jgi:ribokinase
MPTVVVLGDINIDVLMPVPDYPQPGGETLSEGVTISLGGSAANTAIVLVRLGATPRMVARVGQDPWAEMALEALGQAGVEVSCVQRDAQAPTGMMFTPVTPDGERTMFGQRGANPRFDPTLIKADIFTGARWLHLSGYAMMEDPQRQATLRAIDLAGQLGLSISMDTALLPALVVPEQIRQVLPRLAMCVLGPEEARALAGVGAPERAALALVEAGVGLVGLKLGAGGCWLADREGLQRIPPFPAQAVDSTGAGDTFSAGLVYGRLYGLSLPACGILANALGSLATATHGAGAALPGREAVRRLLERNLAVAEGERREWIWEALDLLKSAGS